MLYIQITKLLIISYLCKALILKYVTKNSIYTRARSYIYKIFFVKIVLIIVFNVF